MRSPSPIDPPPIDGEDTAAPGRAAPRGEAATQPAPAPAPAERPARPARRSFLLGGVGATAALAAAPRAAQAVESPQEQVEQRYSRTPHVERFYFLNRL